jgi:hypothetical protein
MFIESPADETEEQFRAFVTELIVSIYKRVPDWLEYQVGGRFELRGRFYRQFICSAGSVSIFIHQRAIQPGGISRSIVERGEAHGARHCWEIHSGVETEFEHEDLRAA